jgi:hypothetical protein
MSHPDLDMHWKVHLREDNEILIVGTRGSCTFVWAWDIESMTMGPEFVDIIGGALEPGEFPPRPSAEMMDRAERILTGLLLGDPDQESQR